MAIFGSPSSIIGPGYDCGVTLCPMCNQLALRVVRPRFHEQETIPGRLQRIRIDIIMEPHESRIKNYPQEKVVLQVTNEAAGPWKTPLRAPRGPPRYCLAVANCKKSPDFQAFSVAQMSSCGPVVMMGRVVPVTL